MDNFFDIQTVRDLYRALAVQHSITRQASLELDEIVTSVVTPANQNDEDYLADAVMNRECELLEKYAKMPTLTEHSRSEALQGAFQQGATFGVALIVGEVILSNVRALANVFTRVHRTLLMLMLSEFNRPVSEDPDLVETFCRAIRVELRDDAKGMSERDRKAHMRSLITPLAEALVLVCERYKMIENADGEGWVLTGLGERVMLHLFDAQRFISTVAESHARLQKEEAKV